MATTERVARTASTLVVVAIGALYVATAARTVLGGDNGELVAVAASGGVAHPPGYPLYVLLLRAGMLLPGVSPAHRAALATAVIATASVAALGWAARAWGATRASSTAAAALFAVGPLAWILGTHAEVFALNVLLAMLIVGNASPRLDPPLGRESMRALALGLLAGLGLSNHHTIVLLAPIGLFAVVRATRLDGLRALGAATAGLVVGLAPYAYVVARANAVPEGQGCVWGEPRDLAGVVRHFLRAEYGTFQLSISDVRPEPLEHVLALGERLVADLFGAPLVLLVALVVFLRVRDRATPLSAWTGHATLVLSLVLAGPVFVSRFNLATHGVAATVTERFHLLPLALTSVLFALSLDACVRAATANDAARAEIARRTLAAAALVVVLLRAGASYGAVQEHHRPTIENYVENVLAMVPERSIVLATGDDRTGAFMYARCALHLRPDVVAITPVLLLNEWYPRQVSARLGFPVVHGERTRPGEPPVLSARALVDQLVATGRPVYVTDWFAKGLDRTTPSYPIGPLIRVVARPDEVPDPERLAALNEEVSARFALEPTLPRKGTWAGARMLDYARPWGVLAGAFEAAGEHARAEEFRARARSLTPR